jgi:putative transcriptional regulator
MPLSYKKLFHLLIDRGMKKGELQDKAGITASIMARLAKDEIVRTDTISKICEALDCQPSDIMEYIPLNRKSLIVTSQEK